MQVQIFSISPRGSLSKTEGSFVPFQHHLIKGRQVTHHLFWVPVSLSVTWFLIQRGKLHRTILLGSNTLLAAPAFFALCPQYPAWALCYPLIRNHQHSTWWQSFPRALETYTQLVHMACDHSRNKTTAIQKKRN